MVGEGVGRYRALQPVVALKRSGLCRRYFNAVFEESQKVMSTARSDAGANLRYTARCRPLLVEILAMSVSVL